MSRYDIVCIHTIVGYAPAHAAHFSTRASGEILQSRDTKFRSAANLNGNYRVIAIENEDHGAAYGSWSGSNVPPFTPEQCEAIARICAWANQVHGIPLALCPDSRPTSRGIAYHRQGCDGNFTDGYGGRVSGGEQWSSAFGKVCPGTRRINQLINTIIPRAQQIANGEEDDMFTERDRIRLENIEEKQLHMTLGKVGRWRDGVGQTGEGDTDSGAAWVRTQFDQLTAAVSDLQVSQAQQGAALTRIQEALQRLEQRP